MTTHASDVPALETRVIEDLRQVYAALQMANLPTWLKLDITMAQLKALVTIEGAGETTIGGVAERLSITESSASLLVDQLVRRGFAARDHDAADRRRVLVSVTELGRELLVELRHGRRQTLHEWLAGLKPGELASVAAGLSALRHAADDGVAALRHKGDR